MDPNGKAPLVDRSAAWLQGQPARHRAVDRRRVRRRKRSDVRAKIRLRIWLACTGALLVMALGIYLALGHQRGGESGQLDGATSGLMARAGAAAFAA